MAKKEVEGKDSRLGIVVSNVMTKNLISVKRDDPLIKAIKIMAKKRISCILVVEDSKAIGIITERDLLHKLLAKDKRPDGLLVKDLMTSPVLAISQDYDVVTAGNIMRKNKIRRLAVEEEEKVIGVITETDVVNATIQYIKHLNWRLVEGQITNKEYERILKDVKMLVNF